MCIRDSSRRRLLINDFVKTALEASECETLLGYEYDDGTERFKLEFDYYQVKLNYIEKSILYEKQNLSENLIRDLLAEIKSACDRIVNWQDKLVGQYNPNEHKLLQLRISQEKEYCETLKNALLTDSIDESVSKTVSMNSLFKNNIIDNGNREIRF